MFDTVWTTITYMAQARRDVNKAVVSDNVLLHLSHELSPKEWRNVARNLNISNAKIDQISDDHRQNVQEQIYRVLLLWKQKEGQGATKRILVQALKQASRKDLADGLSEGMSKSFFLVLFILPIPIGCFYLWPPSQNASDSTVNKPKENSLEWFEATDDNFLTIGGVMVKPNQMVHLSFENSIDGILLHCFNPHSPGEKYWQHIEDRIDRNTPIVMSRRAIFYDDTSHVLFAAGNKVYIAHLHVRNNVYTKVESVSVLTIAMVDPGTWITNIFGHQPTADPCDEFLLTVSSSNKLFVYNALGNIKQVVDTKDVPSLHMDLSKVAFCESNFALVDNSHEDIVLISVEGKVQQFTLLKPPVSGCVPIDVICTGVRWLILYSVNVDSEQTWMVATYKTKHTEDFKINDRGKYQSKSNRPVSITHSKKSGYVTFANDTVRHFKFGTWKTD